MFVSLTRGFSTRLLARTTLLTCLAVGLLLGSTFRVAAQDGLKDFAPPNFYVGGVLHGDDESFQNPLYRAEAEKHFNMVTSSVYMPWGLWKGPDQEPDFSKFESAVDWSIEKGMKVHGHVLLFPWANTQSKWWMELPNERVEPLLFRYVDGLTKARAGKIHVWDVVNEVIANDGEPMDADGLRTNNKEYQAMGASYIDKVFQWASEADPQAQLILNSTGCEWLGSKSDRMYNYVVKLKQRGVPIHGVGFQFHFVDVQSPRPDIASMRANLQRFADAGFDIYITEVDVCSLYTKDPQQNQPSKEQLERQALHFRQTMELALAQPACKAYLLWDFADDYSWLHPSTSQIHTLPADNYSFPSPFSGGKDSIEAKPAVAAMRDALKAADRKDR